MIKKIGIALILLVLFGIAAFFLGSRSVKSPEKEDTDNIVIENGDKSDLIRNINIKPGDSISSPLIITGEARGYWYFEASFPVVLVNWDGLIIASGIATAQDEWMTEDFVPFKATIAFDKPSYGENGALILQKDNPSGLPEFDDALEISIKFE
ncbi:MAG: Gmad2 immunoglobulin-like domain-containing protein [Candidatus Colwellbacteria bacterium]|nr:Gmad2 immunoglobulin-like domain-containing protein [Candidatus Colwellbacteria bacterium]